MASQQNRTHLPDSYLSKDQLLRLIKIQLSFNPIFMHDVKNPLTAIGAAIQILEERYKFPNSFDKLAPLFEILKEEIKNIDKILEYYSYTFRTDPTQQIFISNPFRIAQEIIKRFRPVKIEINRNCLHTLEFFFPRSILFGILLELINNAVNHNESNCTIHLIWKVTGKKFECEIHDSGKGILSKDHRGFATIDVLPPHIINRIDTSSGLSTINRILRISSGSLLFSSSKSLGGAMVRFEFPILVYYKKGTIYDLRDQG